MRPLTLLHGRLAKTDRIDALVLAQFAQAIKPEVRELKDEHTQQLEALLARRRQILAMLTAERQRRRSPHRRFAAISGSTSTSW